MKRFPLHASTLAPLIIIAILLSFMPVHPAHAAAITVSTFDDELTTNGKCSLREAIANANDGGPTPTYPDCPAGSGADTIVLSAGSYVLSIPGPDEEQNQTGDLDIRSNMTIIGADLYATTIDGNAATTLDRVFHIHIGTNVRLSNMSIIKGSSSINGGGILNEHAMLTLYRVEIGINKAINNGGGIFNDGGTLTLSKSIIGGNSADGNGGGIANDAGTVAFVDSNTMNDNYAKANGGGIFNNHNLIVDGLWLHDNRADNSGAGIYSSGITTISNSPIQSNRAELSGGNIYSGDSVGLSSLTITNSEVRNGLANADGGGIYNDGGLSLTNVTITTNLASRGDGIFNVEATQPMTLTNVTVAYNNPYNGHAGGGIYNAGAALTLKNTLVAYNRPNDYITDVDCFGSVASAGHNLDAGNTCGLSATGDITNTKPLLGPFHDNGGRTYTYALLQDSPAINAGTNAGCPNTDQRGGTRPHGAFCDIGAYEANYAPTAAADTYETNEETPLSVDAIHGVLANDTEPDHDALTAVLAAGPSHGTLTLNSDGSFSYTPSPNYSGADSFSYHAYDGDLASTNVVVTLTVHWINKPPVAHDDAASTPANTALVLPVATLLANDTDVDGQPLSVSGVSAASAHGGAAALVGDHVIYTPRSGFVGSDSFTYTASDGSAGSATAIVRIGVTYDRTYLPLLRR